LGVDPESEERVVKKAFKKLSLIYHPDKVKPEEKETAETKFIEISKAYKVLTDEESRKKWEEFGHPDGKQAAELGLALPSWLLEKGNTGLVLLVYTIIFGIALPVIVARWWRNAKITSKNQVLNDTMGIFYRELNDNLGFKSLLEILIKAEEFQRMDFEKYDFQMVTFNLSSWKMK
jgi:translocation protein SEC63